MIDGVQCMVSDTVVVSFKTEICKSFLLIKCHETDSSQYLVGLFCCLLNAGSLTACKWFRIITSFCGVFKHLALIVTIRQQPPHFVWYIVYL